MAMSAGDGSPSRSTRDILFSILLASSLILFGYLDSANPKAVADAGPVDHRLINRQSDVCTRWAQQSAIVNGTLYLYGGQASTDPSQTQNTWNNNFLSLELTKSWQISSPLLTSLPQPSGPPAVSLGTLWASYDTLYLYGGEFSSKPPVTPEPFALWQYNVPQGSWTSEASPQADDGSPVQRAAEGAGASAAGNGRGWYFGGHQDGYTTVGWSQSVPRIYLKSLLEFTFPGSGASASSTGTFRNITAGGAESSNGFPERADGVLVYVPNIGSEGILLGLAGGTATTFTQLNVIDVYDISSSTWYKQSTAGPTPKIRVNPCAVAAVAPDGSSVNVYMYGGQNLQPADAQTQLGDMWILTLPSFTWISVDTSTQSAPMPRAGHTCNVWDGQMVVVGGYVGADVSCDSPGVYVFDLTNLSWQQSFTASSDHGSNPQAKQLSQIHDPDALPGSFGYGVPQPVQKGVGGNEEGGATVTVPVAAATIGPLTNSPKTYAVSTTSTAAASKDDGSLTTGTEVAIAMGILGFILLSIAAYLAICAWLYRKRMRMYQWNMQTARTALTEQRASVDESALSPTAHDYFGSANGSSPYSDVSTPKRKVVDGATIEGEKTHGTMRRSSEDLLSGQEPSFVGIMLHPRRSLRVVNS